MTALIRPCNKPTSGESACLSSLIGFNPFFSSRKRENQWRKIHTHSERPSSWLVSQKSHSDRWHLCNWLTKGPRHSSHCNFCFLLFLSGSNWWQCLLFQTDGAKGDTFLSVCFSCARPWLQTGIVVKWLENRTWKTLWFSRTIGSTSHSVNSHRLPHDCKLSVKMTRFDRGCV